MFALQCATTNGEDDRCRLVTIRTDCDDVEIFRCAQHHALSLQAVFDGLKFIPQATCPLILKSLRSGFHSGFQ
jgi:hypothetical protein